MCFSRLSSELHARPTPPNPLEISLERGPFFPADFAAIMRAVRMMLTAAVEFGRTTFSEFTELTESEKWTLATSFFYRFRVFEGCYRANKYFPDKPNMYFVSYSSYCSFPPDEHFLSTEPPGADVVGAVQLLYAPFLIIYISYICMTRFYKKSEMAGDLRSARELIARVNPSEEEFIVVVVLIFWTYGDVSTGDNIIRICEKYGRIIQKELHAYYRDELGLENYAARMGELMMLTQLFDVIFWNISALESARNEVSM
ncbi:hypothetical protein PENTCL1PPCAC_14202 [Pristionchus entomophagus]|uniref:NR LBD domain-containing protein n=1 Tax=Pristionchus entomophagus TaxID=358040 RepID=A0AAV5TCH0_9BILA|nr:hypothetical protein PENTCL1PPCAC_14202 [Pristionchus entomophagus]